jgi:hypothetical protein
MNGRRSILAHIRRMRIAIPLTALIVNNAIDIPSI